MTDLILFLPLALAALVIILRSRVFNAAASLFYAVIYLAGAATLFMARSGAVAPKWESLYMGRYFRVDGVNALFLLILALVYAGVSLYTVHYFRKEGITSSRQARFTALLLLFVFSMTGVILSTHLGLLWVFIEATTLATASLIYFEGTKMALEAAWKYIFINSIGIAFAFVGLVLLSIGLPPGQSLFIEDIIRGGHTLTPLWLKLGFVFMLTGFSTKMGLAPVHAWLPDAHSEAPSPISALLSGSLLNMALLANIRLFSIMKGAGMAHYASGLLVVMGFFSVFISAVYILRVSNYKRMLAYSSIENMGLAALGIAAGGAGFMAAAIGIFSHSLMKASFFLASGNIYGEYRTKDSREVRGLFTRMKLTGWIWVLCLVAASGFPPFPGLYGKLMLVKAFMDKGNYFSAALLLLLLSIILYGMARTVIGMCFGGSQSNAPAEKEGVLSVLPQFVLIGILAAAGLFMPGFLYNIFKLLAESI